MKDILNSKLMRMLLIGNTNLLRFFFSLCSFGFAAWVMFDPNYPIQHPYAVTLASPHAQGLLFMVHGFAMMHGVVTGRYSHVLLFMEGVLGVFLWCGIGVAETLQQRTPGPLIMASLIALFLLIRYPTHYGVVDAD